jgi:hypothetical protein
LRVGDGKAPSVKVAAAPQDDVEVEHPRPPASTAPPAEVVFDRLEASEHCGRLEVALNQDDGIGEITTGSAVRCVEHDARCVEQAELPV